MDKPLVIKRVNVLRVEPERLLEFLQRFIVSLVAVGNRRPVHEDGRLNGALIERLRAGGGQWAGCQEKKKGRQKTDSQRKSHPTASVRRQVVNPLGADY